MQSYNEFLSERIKLLADEISNNVTNDDANIQEAANMSKEIYAYCKVLLRLKSGGGSPPPQLLLRKRKYKKTNHRVVLLETAC